MKPGSAVPRTLPCLALLAIVLIPNWGEAQVSVEILDAPSTAYSFEPIHVTYEVRNGFSYPIVIPGDPFSPQGTFLRVGLRGDPLTDSRKISDLSPSRLVWLPPGGRWLFFQHVELGPEGVFEIQAVLRSPGECQGRPVGPEANRAQPVRPVVRGARPYDCWSGETESGMVEVIIEIPSSEPELAVLDYLGVDRVGSPKGLLFNLKELIRRFPSSHYTYAGLQAAGGGGCSMLDAVILQPDNALNPWVAAGIAECLAYRNRPCAGPEHRGPGGPADLDERFERVIATYPPPAPVQDYLRQLEAELASEECPVSGGATKAEELDG